METLLEHILVSTYKAGMISFMEAHPEAYDEAAALAVSDNQPYSWRAAWLLWSCMKENDLRIKSHVNKFVKYIPYARNNQKRELLKMLLMMKLTDKQEGLLFDECIILWEDISMDPSIRITALKMLLKIARKYPELSREITLVTQGHYISTLSPGVKHSVNRLLKKLTY